MDPAATFYQVLATTSFTLLGLWFTIVQFSHGGWRSDPGRHRSGLHIALHFFLPGLASLASLLGAGAGGTLLWRVVFVVVGVVGLAEAVSFLRDPHGPQALAGRALSFLGPVLYALMVVGAFVPPRLFALTPLQVEGTVTGALFLVGLCFAWLAFAERAEPARTGIATGGDPPRRSDPAAEDAGA